MPGSYKAARPLSSLTRTGAFWGAKIAWRPGTAVLLGKGLRTVRGGDAAHESGSDRGRLTRLTATRESTAKRHSLKVLQTNERERTLFAAR